MKKLLVLAMAATLLMAGSTFAFNANSPPQAQLAIRHTMNSDVNFAIMPLGTGSNALAFAQTIKIADIAVHNNGPCGVLTPATTLLLPNFGSQITLPDIPNLTRWATWSEPMTLNATSAPTGPIDDVFLIGTMTSSPPARYIQGGDNMRILAVNVILPNRASTGYDTMNAANVPNDGDTVPVETTPGNNMTMAKETMDNANATSTGARSSHSSTAAAIGTKKERLPATRLLRV